MQYAVLLLANLIYLKTYRITNTTKVLITKLCTCDSMFHHILIYSITLHLYFQFIFWFSNFLSWSMPDECYFRNVLCALNWISTFYCIKLGNVCNKVVSCLLDDILISPPKINMGDYKCTMCHQLPTTLNKLLLTRGRTFYFTFKEHSIFKTR